MQFSSWDLSLKSHEGPQCVPPLMQDGRKWLHWVSSSEESPRKTSIWLPGETPQQICKEWSLKSPLNGASSLETFPSPWASIARVGTCFWVSPISLRVLSLYFFYIHKCFQKLMRNRIKSFFFYFGMKIISKAMCSFFTLFFMDIWRPPHKHNFNIFFTSVLKFPHITASYSHPVHPLLCVESDWTPHWRLTKSPVLPT